MVLRLNLSLCFCAIVLLLSCADIERDSPNDPGSGDYVYIPSSSSSAPPPVSYGVLSYYGQTYKTVQIGTQVWMAENLNYNAGGSVCYGNNSSNCTIYGRLYNWATAMGLSSSCNSSPCASQVQSKHQGICPSGWHIPSDADWTTLTNYVESQGGCSSCSGTRLKATSGWNSGYYATDEYGFSALPGGGGDSDGDFRLAGDRGDWWSSTEYDVIFACRRGMFDVFSEVFEDFVDKSSLFSVRCLQDYEYEYILSSSSSIELSSSSSIEPSSSSLFVSVPCGNASTDGGTVTCDGQTYRTVRIGTQVWMAENLNYDVPDNTTDVCYDNNSSNCTTYGRLYDWATAMGLNPSCNSINCASEVQSKHQGICPSGWHIPSDDDWSQLINYVGSNSVAGKHLKAETGWSDCGPSDSGSSYLYSCEDTHGFSALPGGFGGLDGRFSSVGNSGYWWSANENSSGNAYYRSMGYGNDDVYWSHGGKTNLLSVRCVQD